MNEVILVGWVVAAVSGGILLYVHYQLARDAHWFRCYSVRYPMFKIRDRLVELVTTGKMSRENPAWDTAYRTTNALVSLHKRANVFSAVRDYISFEQHLRNNAEEAGRMRRLDEALENESERNPEFHNLLDDLSEAGRAVLDCETSLAARLLIKAIRLIAYSHSPTHRQPDHGAGVVDAYQPNEPSGSAQAIGTYASLIEWREQRSTRRAIAA